MPQVTLTVHGRVYDVACGDGEEGRLADLGRIVDHTVSALAAKVGPVGETRLLLLACLQLADQLDDARAAGAAMGAGDGGGLPIEDALTENLDALAQRIEDIAARLKPT